LLDLIDYYEGLNIQPSSQGKENSSHTITQLSLSFSLSPPKFGILEKACCSLKLCCSLRLSPSSCLF
jgi:hypothetical protein